MKYLSLAFVLMSFHFASANPVAIGNYKGHAEGAIRLNTADGSAILGAGALEVSVEKVNPFKNPVHFVKKARLVKLKNETMDSFQFLIPGNTEFVNGEANISAEVSSQTADINIRESHQFISSKEEPHTRECSHYSYCMTCGMGMDGNQTCGAAYGTCPGEETVLSKVDSYARTLEFTITNGAQLIRIKTEATPEDRRTDLKTLEECH